MAEIEEALVALLLADVTVAALVGDNVGPWPPPPDDAYPQLTYFRVSTPRTHTMGNTPGGVDTTVGVRPRFQLDAWAKTLGQVTALATAVVNALDGWRGIAGGYRIDAALVVDEADVPEDDTGLRRRRVDVTIATEEAI